MSDRFLQIEGGVSLSGSVDISGSKNAALPILASTLILEKPVVIHNVPNIADVLVMLEIVKHSGAKVEFSGSSVLIDASTVSNYRVHHSACKSRSSILTAGPILQRCGRVVIPMPGGCQIGSRLINFHIDAFEKMGATVNPMDDQLEIIKTKDLLPIEFDLPLPSVGATQHIVSVAAVNNGLTIINNAAIEPEVVQACEFLASCGAKIDGIGSRRLSITGVGSLFPTEYRVASDRIEAGTYAFAIIATRGTAVLNNIKAAQAPELLNLLGELGVAYEDVGDGIKIFGNTDLNSVDIRTSPHPGFPTDLQSPLTALLAQSAGRSHTLRELVHDARFGHVPELVKMGAKIKIDGSTILIDGVDSLSGSSVRGTDLRASKSLVIAGLGAKGQTSVFGLDQLNRGYEKIVYKLQTLGARVKESFSS